MSASETKRAEEHPGSGRPPSRKPRALSVVPVVLGCCREHPRCLLCPPPPPLPSPSLVRHLVELYKARDPVAPERDASEQVQRETLSLRAGERDQHQLSRGCAETGRVAAELQFRTVQRGNRQVVNDVWVATVEGGRIAVIKEDLDGRVKDLQALGVLTLEESPAFLTPWPSRTEAWAACFPIAKTEMANSCPPS